MSDTLSLRESLLKLAGLSDLESKIFRLKNLIDLPPEELQQKNQNLQKAEKNYSQKKKTFEDLESKYKEVDFALKDDQEKIKTKEARIYEIKTTKEYQAASKEISDTKRINLEREKQILQLMEDIENLKAELSPLETEFNELQTGVQNMSTRLEEERVTHRQELQEAEQVKQKLFESIDSALIGRYEKVLQRRRPAVSPVRAGQCEECNVKLPPQMYILLQRCNEVMNCPSCQRILYIPLE